MGDRFARSLSADVWRDCLSLNGWPICKELVEHQIKPLPAFLFQPQMVLANFFSHTLSTAMYLTLNALAASQAGNRKRAAIAKFCQVDFTEPSAAASPINVMLTDFQPRAEFVTLHVATAVPIGHTSWECLNGNQKMPATRYPWWAT